MQLSVIVPLHGFNPQREQAVQMLLNNLAAQDLRTLDTSGNPTEDKDFEVIVVEQECDQGFHSLPDHKWLKHIRLPKQRAFNKSWCMNVAANAAQTKTLVFLDVDMLFGKNFLSKILYFKRSDAGLFYFTCWSYICFLPGKDEPVLRVVDPSIFTAGGAFCTDKTFFWTAGGMNENYFGYGGEDNDLWVRVNARLGKKTQVNIPHMPYALVHWYHDWSQPSEERFYHLNRTVEQPEAVIAKLRQAGLGNPSGPIAVDVSDIKLKNSGLDTKEGKGLV